MAGRRINLMPPTVAKRRAARRLSGLMGLAGVGLLAIFALVFTIQVVRLSGVRKELRAEQAKGSALQAEIGKLREFDELKKELDRKTSLLGELTAAEVRWSVVLADVSLVIPSDVWLTTFSATLSVAEPGAAEPAGASIGQLQFGGTTFAHTDVARWLTRLGDVAGFANPYLSTSTKGSIGSTDVVNFNSTADLSEKALRRNQPGAGRKL